MSVPDDVSYFSRFLMKFVEIIAAGLATAASGYLIAHLSGALSSPASAPAAAVIQVVPNTSMASGSLRAQPIPPVSADINEQRLTPQEVNAPRAAQPARNTKAEPPRKPIDSTTNAAESTRDQESFVARVQAALANVNATRKNAPDVSPKGDVTRGPAAIGQPGPLIDPAAAAVVTAIPGAAELGSPSAHEAAPKPLTAIEIKSAPVAAVQLPSAPLTGNESGGFSALEQMLRHDPLATTDEAPRPPMPVGE